MLTIGRKLEYPYLWMRQTVPPYIYVAPQPDPPSLDLDMGYSLDCRSQCLSAMLSDLWMGRYVVSQYVLTIRTCLLSNKSASGTTLAKTTVSRLV